MSRSAVWRPNAALLLVLLLVAGGCDSTGPDGDAYTLTAVGGALPGGLPCCGGTVQATAGSLRVASDDGVEQRLQLRCAPGTSCTIPDEWRVMTGELDRAEGRIDWSTGVTSLAAFDAGVAVLTYPLPPSQGGFGTVEFRFER